jgi:alpha-L-fucosidase
VDPAAVPYPGADGPNIVAALRTGDPYGTVWRPGETEVSIRPGWFYHPAEDAKVKTVDQLVDLYFTSVGRNSKLLLNVPPTRAGLLHETDVARLAGMRQRLGELFRAEHAGGTSRRGDRRGSAAPSARSTSAAFVRCRLPTSAKTLRAGRWCRGIVSRERRGRRVASCPRERRLVTGLDRFQPVSIRAVRLTLEMVGPLTTRPRVQLFQG